MWRRQRLAVTYPVFVFLPDDVVYTTPASGKHRTPRKQPFHLYWERTCNVVSKPGRDAWLTETPADVCIRTETFAKTLFLSTLDPQDKWEGPRSTLCKNPYAAAQTTLQAKHLNIPMFTKLQAIGPNSRFISRQSSVTPMSDRILYYLSLEMPHRPTTGSTRYFLPINLNWHEGKIWYEINVTEKCCSKRVRTREK